MPEVIVDRLALRLPGFSEAEGRRLARLVADGLAAAPGAGRPHRRIESLRVNVSAQPGTNLNRLAEQIVAEALRQLG